MRNVVIENEQLRININPLGAELVGLVDKGEGVEHMWHGDPKFWPRRAPILFPTIGESKNGKINIDGAEYPMGRHGFARHLDFEVVDQKKNEVTFRLISDAATKKHYPFEFEFEVTYSLTGKSLLQTHDVRNIGSGEMGFQLGGHPAFAVPFKDGEKYAEYEVHFDKPITVARHLLKDNGLFSGEKRSFLNDRSSFGLNYELFKEDALVFKDIDSKKVWIQHKNGGKRLVVEYDGFPHLGIWSVPRANYICLEPWIGCADSADQNEDLWRKDSLVLLAAGREFSAEFSITLDHIKPKI